MKKPLRLFFTVTNDLEYDQRMAKICGSLASRGYEVVLVGRRSAESHALEQKSFGQKRLNGVFKKGFLFYAEYNCRLFLYLLFRKIDLICAIDLDTIISCWFISKLKGIPRVYDAHELFCEMQEIATRPRIYKYWKYIERYCVPKFKHGYTVSQPIAEEFRKMYGLNYSLIRNVPLLKPLHIPVKKEKYILYQGAVNEGRSFETLIPAMADVNARLIICGDGNFMEQARSLVQQYGLNEKVIFKGMLSPAVLKEYTLNAWVGVTLFENRGLSNYYSLANRFFDYMHAGIPQLCVGYPAYREINSRFNCAVLIDHPDKEDISRELNNLLDNEPLYNSLQQNCIAARQVFNWEEEEKKLFSFYNSILETVG
jgi:glycosyltransferase involved in cell wall biosynthesis